MRAGRKSPASPIYCVLKTNQYDWCSRSLYPSFEQANIEGGNIKLYHPFFDNTGGSIVDVPMRISRLEIAMGYAADSAVTVKR